MFFKKEDKGGSFDYLIVGLGNPGDKYEKTRHNIGFITLDELSKQFSAPTARLKFKSLLGEATIGGKRCLLCKPQTFMNNSGEAVAEIMNFYKLSPEQVLVILDDVTLDVGRLRIRRKGSDGGHNGMKSIIYLTGSDNIARIKIGVGKKPHPDYDLAAWVLGRFRAEDGETLYNAVKNAVAATALIVGGEINKAMCQYNG